MTCSQPPPSNAVPSPSKERLEELCVSAVISSNVSFKFLDNPFFRKLFNKIPYNFSLPGRITASTTILDRMYERIVADRNKKIAASPAVSLIIDGWTNVRSAGVVNTIVCLPQPLFFSSEESHDNTHNAAFFEGVFRRAADACPSVITGLVTDNANVMLAVADLIRYVHLMMC